MLRRVMLLSALLFAGPAAARPAEIVSWGKPGVSFDQYRADAIACAKQGYFRDVSNDAPAKRFIRGFETGERALNGGGGPDIETWRNSILMTQPDRQKRLLHTIQVGDVETCLTTRGYAPFTLTPAQRAMLVRYKPGSPERHRYLHALAAR